MSVSAGEACPRVLVTGAGGFVGANLVRRLAADGHAVVAAVRPGGDPWRLTDARGVELRQVELSDADAVGALVREARPQWAFHLAAHGAHHWQTDARAMFATNVLGTVNLVEACRAVGCEAFVNAGSSSEYGYKDHAPDEDEPLEPNSDYAVAKASGTLYCRHAARAGEMRVATLRLYSVYGPYDAPDRLVSTLASRGLRGELPPLADPDVARDYVAVADVVDAFLRCAADGPSGAVYNVGSGRQTSIREAVAIARRTLDIDAEPRWSTAPRRRWDTTTWVARTDRIERELGWRASIGLEDGFRSLVEWLRASPEVWPVYGVRAPS